MSYATIDVETTGIYPGGHDRIVEVAVVSLSTDLEPTGEFTTLVNPERDMGPTWLHGIQAADVLPAPTFPEIAGLIADALRDAVVVGHNVTFDLRFLESEFARAGHPVQRPPYFDTMSGALQIGAPSRRLEDVCSFLGIDCPQAHSALHDARAAADLFLLCADRLGRHRLDRYINGDSLVRWPRVPPTREPVPRERAAELRRARKPFLARLVEDLPVTPGERHDWQPYYAVLDRALEDRRISQAEAAALTDAALEAGLSADDVVEANESYLRTLVAVALRDNVLSDSERSDLQEVARLLDLEDELESLLTEPSAAVSPESPAGTRESLAGCTVCFTGALNASIDGERVTRERATEIAQQHGLTVATSVTKRLDVLVIADPDSMSGKAKKARKYGTRILAESVFWNRLGVNTDG